MKMQRLGMSVLIAVMAVSAVQIVMASPTTKQITVANNSDVTITPTAEGFMNGCVGGSLPVVSVTPHTSRKMAVVFVNYSSSCRFNVLPKPNIVTYDSACHGVKVNDTVTFEGQDSLHMKCADSAV